MCGWVSSIMSSIIYTLIYICIRTYTRIYIHTYVVNINLPNHLISNHIISKRPFFRVPTVAVKSKLMRMFVAICLFDNNAPCNWQTASISAIPKAPQHSQTHPCSTYISEKKAPVALADAAGVLKDVH